MLDPDVLAKIPISDTVPDIGELIPLIVTVARSPTLTLSIVDRATVVETVYCPAPITVIVLVDELAVTLSPAVSATSATVPVIGLVSTAAVRFCLATVTLA